MVKMLTVEAQIAKRSQEYPAEALTNLHSFIAPEMMAEVFAKLKKKGANGVDGESWQDFDEEKESRIEALHTAFKAGSYRAPNIRRVYIPKGDGKLRPLGIPTVTDKLLQTVVSKTLTPVYEQIFYDCSYGFRPGRSQHQALDVLFKEVSFKGLRYVIDADLKNYFGSINHQCLRAFLDLRIKDGVIRRQIDKWLKAGVLEDGQVYYPEDGTPQGGSVSPLLSNIYLHYVLDEWFIEQIQPLLGGRSSIIRFADDFLLCFDNKEDAERVMEVLPQRMARYKLTLHPEKTKLVSLASQSGEKSGTFDFLGFTHFMAKSRKGRMILKRKTSSKKLNSALKRMHQWIKFNRHLPIKELIRQLNRKLIGYYNYYGITFNSRRLAAYFGQVKRMLHKWLNRRGGKPKWNWERVTLLVAQWTPLAKPKIYHKFS